jgi:hypothetical protein
MNFPFRLASMFQPNTGSGQTRTEIWKAAWRAIGDRPFFGHGLDTFRLLFPRYKTARYVADAGHGSIADNAHNYPLQLAMGAGIPGAMLAYGFFGLVLWRAAPFAFQRSTSADRLPLAGFWAACIGYLVHLMFGLSVVGSSFLLWLALGLLLASSVQSVEVTIPRGSKAAAAGLTALMVLAFLVNASFLVADRHYLMAKDSTQVMGDRIAHLKMAMRLNPANDPYRSEVGYAHMEGVADLLRKEELLQQGVQGAAGELTQARQAIRDAATGFEEAINHSPLEYDNYLNLAALYNQASSLDASYAADALWWAERGMAIEPYGPGVLYQAALAQDLLGQREAAIVLLQKAAAMDPNYPAPQVKLRELQRQQPAVNAHP